MLHTVTVTIGRNKNTEPMPGQEWWEFTEDTIRCVERVIPQTVEIFETKDGIGHWENLPQEPIAEESRSLKWYYRQSISDFQRAAINVRLGSLLHAYGQDAIAIEYGESNLILG